MIVDDLVYNLHFCRVRARVQEVEEGEPTQERFFRPHFLQAPGDMVAHEGRLCRLDCKVCHPNIISAPCSQDIFTPSGNKLTNNVTFDNSNNWYYCHFLIMCYLGHIST